jgi:protein-S-isoprenylcysteine O-methyltransferase Ste14
MTRTHDTAPGEPARQRLGSALVALQVVLIVALAARAAPRFFHDEAPTGAWVLATAGAALGLWALYWNRPGNFNVRPTPRAGGRLVQGGPYRWIRHPMYTALIACAGSAVWARPSPWDWLGAAALVAVLLVKAAFEERWMQVEHPGYAAYRARTWRFVPGLF